MAQNGYIDCRMKQDKSVALFLPVTTPEESPSDYLEWFGSSAGEREREREGQRHGPHGEEGQGRLESRLWGSRVTEEGLV